MGWEGMNSVRLTSVKEEWGAVVNMVMNLSASYNAGNFLKI
jgi:hypothetical protein